MTDSSMAYLFMAIVYGLPLAGWVVYRRHRRKQDKIEAGRSLNCNQCGGVMRIRNREEKNMSLQVVGVLLFLLGVILLFMFPIGTFVGLILMISALGLGYKKKKIWKCQECEYFFEMIPGGESVAKNDTFKKCPKCAELIKKEAVVCKHCGNGVAQMAKGEPT